MRQWRKTASPLLSKVIEGGRDQIVVSDPEAVLGELREARELIERQLEHERERAARADEAPTAGRIAREAGALLRAWLAARQWQRWRRLISRICGY
jgi:hypothetical protein